jgi:hypothetical protein
VNVPTNPAVTLLKTLADSGFRAVCPVPKGFTKDSQIKWGLDGLPQTLPAGIQLASDGVPGMYIVNPDPGSSS